MRAVAAIGAAALLGSLVVAATPAYAQPVVEPVVIDETIAMA